MVDKEDININIGEEQNTGEGIASTISDVLVAYKTLISLTVVSVIVYVLYTGTEISVQMPGWLSNLIPFIIASPVIAYMVFPRFWKWVPKPMNVYIFEFHLEGITKAKESDKTSSFLNVGFAKVAQQKFEEEYDIEGEVFQKKNFYICEELNMSEQELIGAELAELSSWELIAYRQKLDHTRNDMLEKYKEASSENVNRDADELFQIFDSMQFIINKIRSQTEIDEESIAEIIEQSGIQESTSLEDGGEEATVEDMMQMVSEETDEQ